VHLVRDSLPEARNPAKLRVVGVGNAWRRDDAVGLVVARHLRELLPREVEVLEHEGEPTALIDVWDGAQRLWLVDASSSGAEPGTIRRFDASSADLPPGFGGATTHHVGLGEAVAMARTLGRLPANVVVFGIEGERFELGAELTPAVAEAVPAVATAICLEVAQACSGAGNPQRVSG
jgi:hydrogenase maturation protease